MLKSMEKNMKYIFWMVTFGLMGILLVAVVTYITKVSKRYPKAFEWIIVVTFVFICIIYIYIYI